MTLTCSTQGTNALTNTLPFINLQSKENIAFIPAHPHLDERISQAREKAFKGIHPLTQPKNNCAIGLIGGAASSLIAKHPLPFLLGLTECISSVWAQEKIGSEFQVNTYTTLTQWFPSVAALSSGNFVVTWQSDGQDGSGYGVYGQIFDRLGSKVGSEFQVNTYTTSWQASFSVAALSSGNFVVTWHSEGQDGSSWGVYGQIFDGVGSKVGSEFQVNTYTTSYQTFPSVAALSSDNFVVTWMSDGQDGSSWGVYGQLFDGPGSKVGSEFQVNTYTTLEQASPSAAALSSGNFVVTWHSEGQDGSSWGVFGQIFDGPGSKVGSEFQVNTYTTLYQTFPSVAALSSGNFVVTWQSDGQDGSNYGVYGQLFDGPGSKVGSEFQVNTYTTLEQASSSVAVLSSGNFAVTWASDGQDGSSNGIYGQIFHDNITQIATTGTTASTGSTGSQLSSTTQGLPTTAATGTTGIVLSTGTSASTTHPAVASSSAPKSNLSWLWGVLGATAAVCVGVASYVIYRKRSRQNESADTESNLMELSGSSSFRSADEKNYAKSPASLKGADEKNYAKSPASLKGAEEKHYSKSPASLKDS